MTPAERIAKQKKPRRKLSGKDTPWICTIGDERRRLGLSQDDVCEEIGLSKSSLSVIEHGTDPLLSTATRLADFFGLPISIFWTKKD